MVYYTSERCKCGLSGLTDFQPHAPFAVRALWQKMNRASLRTMAV